MIMLGMNKRFKVCFVPTCSNNEVNSPEKGFINVPRKVERRDLWCKAINHTGSKEGILYCCEDHFMVWRDCTDYVRDKQRGCTLVVKKNAVPSILIKEEMDSSSSAQPPVSSLIWEESGQPSSSKSAVNTDDTNGIPLGIYYRMAAAYALALKKASGQKGQEKLDDTVGSQSDIVQEGQGEEQEGQQEAMAAAYAVALKSLAGQQQKQGEETNKTILNVPTTCAALTDDTVKKEVENLAEAELIEPGLEIKPAKYREKKDCPDDAEGDDKKTASQNTGGSFAGTWRPFDDLSDATIVNISQVRRKFHLEVAEVNFAKEELMPVPKHRREKKLYICETCGKQFAARGTLNKHLVTHTGEKAFQCDSCGATFALKPTLITHMMSHLDLKPHKCQYCPKRFLTVGLLNVHVRKHTGQNTFGCHVCGASFDSIRKCQAHVRENVSCQRYPCKQCNIDFVSRRELYKHSRIHFKCQVCGKAMGTKDVLDRHVNTVHSKEEPSEECHVCNKKFRTAAYLKKHLLGHMGAMYECTVCHDKFKFYSCLHAHMKTFHGPNGRIVYSCDQCKSKYKSKDGLDRHMKLHSGESFRCVLCFETFVHKATFESHMRKHTGKRLKCLKCQHGFLNRRGLLKHVRKFHGDDPDVFVLMR